MFVAALAEPREVQHHPVPDVPMAGAPIADDRRPLVGYCRRCNDREDEHQSLLHGSERVVLCLVCNRICRRL